MPLEGVDEMQDVLLRPATVEDAPVFRRVFALAGEGLAQWVWQQSATADEDAMTIGLRRCEKKLAETAPGTAIVAEVGGKVAGGVITYDIGDVPEEIEPDTPGVFVPLIALENQALRTHYVNALAVFPGFQGRGIGRKLLRAVAANALENGMSLIAEDANTNAIGLYQSEGYVETARLPVIEGDGWTSPGQNWILMIRPPA